MLFVRQTRHRMWAAAENTQDMEICVHSARGDPSHCPLPASPSSCPATESCFVTCGRRKGWKLEVLLIANIRIMFRNYWVCCTNDRDEAVDFSFKAHEKTSPITCYIALYLSLWDTDMITRLYGVEEWWVGHILFQLSRVVQSIFVQIR